MWYRGQIIEATYFEKLFLFQLPLYSDTKQRLYNTLFPSVVLYVSETRNIYKCIRRVIKV